MKKIHEKVCAKKTRYDMFISIDTASRLEQLCEAHETSKSEMSEMIINDFYNKSPKIKPYLVKITRLKREFKQKVYDDAPHLFDNEELK